MNSALKKARDRKIIVITHEAADIKNADYDVEAFDNAAYGRHLMEEMAKRMNYEGKYIVFVGSLTQSAHNAWVDAAVALQKEKYPKMQLVGTKNESHDDVSKAYQITKDSSRPIRTSRALRARMRSTWSGPDRPSRKPVSAER